MSDFDYNKRQSITPKQTQNQTADEFQKAFANQEEPPATINISKKIDKVVRHNGFLGFVFIFLGFITFISLASYSSLDESFSVVSNKPISNYLGRFGSYLSDMLLQYLGLSAYTIPIWLIATSIDFLNGKKIFIITRLVFFIIFIFSLSFVLCYLTSYKYYFEHILGGYIANDLIFETITQNTTKTYCFIAGFALTSISLLVCFGVFSVKRYLIIFESIVVKIFHFLTFNHLVHIKKNHSTVKHYKLHKTQPHHNIIDSHLQQSNKDEEDNFTEEGLQQGPSNPKQRNELRKLIDKKPKRIQYKKPPETVLTQVLNSQITKTQKNIEFAKQTKDSLATCLLDFGITGSIKSIQVGPVISLFEFEPESGIRAARIIGLSDDIARYLKVPSCRITLISSRGTIGIEIPNIQRETVFLHEIIVSENYKHSKAILPITFGKTIEGDIFVADLSKMPHLLIAGTTGSGKSVGVNAIILSLLYRLSPQQCKFIMIDPKMLELSVYEGIPHLLTPVVTDPKNAVLALKWVLEEMERRYTSMAKIGVRNILGYNEKARESGFDEVPFIVVIVDEMADLMVVSGKAVEISIQRISQMARAAGIHLILATQRPSVDVITGVIKANMPTRASFQVTSSIDSRTIIGTQGAEKLLGMGDMIFVPSGLQMLRTHAPFVSDSEVANIVEYIKRNNPPEEMIDLFSSNEDQQDDDDFKTTRGDEKPSFQESFKFVDNAEFNKLLGNKEEQNTKNDELLYKEAIKIVKEEKRTSISYIQRKLRIGFNKAASLMEQMESDHILSKPDEKGRRIINEENLKKH